jgi:hypothetical protein
VTEYEIQNSNWIYKFHDGVRAMAEKRKMCVINSESRRDEDGATSNSEERGGVMVVLEMAKVGDGVDRDGAGGGAGGVLFSRLKRTGKRIG